MVPALISGPTVSWRTPLHGATLREAALSSPVPAGRAADLAEPTLWLRMRDLYDRAMEAVAPRDGELPRNLAEADRAEDALDGSGGVDPRFGCQPVTTGDDELAELPAEGETQGDPGHGLLERLLKVSFGAEPLGLGVKERQQRRGAVVVKHVAVAPIGVERIGRSAISYGSPAAYALTPGSTAYPSRRARHRLAPWR